MLKKIVLFALILLPLGAFAQEKIAYFNPAEVIVIMPEYKQMQDSLEKTQAAIQTELKVLQEEYNKKYQAFMSEGDSLIESIKIRRLQEIQDMEQRASVYNEQSQQELSKLYQSLLAPIQLKVRDAIQAVGKANGFVYILNAEGLLYTSPNAIDATPLVQKQLGL
ncbi:MAG: OmpH family outer membrane protein [Dysgonamonadaceae bacterium]|jgi:outer membrane protein|nr:OmpH family outer membrane protein [Dysgonamonadaceae bacterium]